MVNSIDATFRAAPDADLLSRRGAWRFQYGLVDLPYIASLADEIECGVDGAVNVEVRELVGVNLRRYCTVTTSSIWDSKCRPPRHTEVAGELEIALGKIRCKLPLHSALVSSG
jgi:hypothetical protein